MRKGVASLLVIIVLFIVVVGAVGVVYVDYSAPAPNASAETVLDTRIGEVQTSIDNVSEEAAVEMQLRQLRMVLNALIILAVVWALRSIASLYIRARYDFQPQSSFLDFVKSYLSSK